jgi:dTDP-4-dehydrorhamnose reductase
VNAGAYTAVDKAEDEIDLCFQVNAEAPRILAEESHKLGSSMIHYSTDYVFDGKKVESYVESDDPNPLNVYGESKLKGESAVLETLESSYVLRTSWVFDPTFGRNFYRTMMRLFRERAEVSVVDDQFGRPTSVQFLVDQTVKIIKSGCTDGSEANADLAGLYHLAELEKMSWAEFAIWIWSQERSVDFLCDSVNRVSSDEYPTLAERPRSSILYCDKWAKAFGELNGE